MSNSRNHHDHDDQFEQFLKESISSEESTIDTARVMKFLDPNTSNKKARTKWLDELEKVDSDDDSDIGLTGTGSKFLKKKPTTSSMRNGPKVTTADRVEKSVSFSQDIAMSRDSLDDESLGLRMNGGESKGGCPVPALSLDSTQSMTATDTMTSTKPKSFEAGKDTLEELADKEKFFQKLERSSDDTLDYSRLNRELDVSATIGSNTIAGTAPPGGRVNGTSLPQIQQNGYLSDEEVDDTENNSPQITAIRNRNTRGHDIDPDVQETPQDKQSMLSRVALMDSLDSPLNTKVGTSHESEDLDTIPERPTEDEPIASDSRPKARKETRFEEAGRGDDDRPPDSTYGRGLTLKTTGTTGLGYTDTSREIEAYHQALQQVGMGTLDDTRDMTLAHSSNVGTLNTSDKEHTAGFGLKPVIIPKTADRSDRTVDDIMREVEELTGRSRDDETETRGFDLSPAHTGHRHHNGYDVVDSMENIDEGYDLSPTDKKKQTVKFLPTDLPDARIPPVSPTRSRSRSKSAGRGRGQVSPDRAPVPAKRKDKRVPRDKYSKVRSSGYGQRSPSPKRTQSQQSKVWSPAEIQKHRVKGSENISKVQRELKMPGRDSLGPQTISDSRLLDSINSFTSYIQEHFGSVPGLTGPEKPPRTHSWLPDHNDPTQRLEALELEKNRVHDAHDWQDQLQEERKLLAKSRAESAALERKFKNTVEQMRVDHEQELFKLRQENYVLSAKATEQDSATKRRAGSLTEDQPEGTSRERVELLEREVQEQERLLASYQTENERLYRQMKDVQQENKATEEKMFRENQRLANEVANLREQLSQKELALRHKGMITAPDVQQQIAAGNMGPAVLGAGRIAQLEAELKQSKAKDQSLKSEIDALTRTKIELQSHIEDLVKQKQLLESRLQHSEVLQSEKTQRKISSLEEEIDKLKNKLKWYVENQELLDKDARLLRKKDEEIQRLKHKIDTLQSETGKKSSEAKVKAKERSVEAKKIQDLERQVREMENIIRKRHPNSLPVLMWAANSTTDASTGSKAPSAVFLERQVEKLQQELDSKDDEAKKSLRALQQKYNSMKLQYEERIQSLEGGVAGARPDGKDGSHPHTHASALQRELDSVKERHKKKQAELEAEVTSLKKELSAAKNKENALKSSESRQLREADSDSQLRIKALSLEVSNQEKHKQSLLKTIETLKQEKEQLVIEATRAAGQGAKAQANKLQSKLQAKVGRPQASKSGSKKASPREEKACRQDSLPLAAIKEAWSDKEYQPMVFAGQHVSDIMRENDDLKQKLDMLQFELDQQRVTIQKMVAEGESQQRKSRESVDEQISALRAAHQSELQRMLADHAIHSSTSCMAELQSKLDTQEVLVRHLRDQLTQSSVDQEKLSALRIRETTLEAQLKQALDEVREAKVTHTPEMKHFASLQDKVKQMEERHAARERELQSVIQHSRAMAHADAAEEVDRWRHMVDAKNRELEKFRSELDSILEVLRVLQRQGVVLPSIHGSSSQLSSHR